MADMQITNLTNNSYTFGPYQLAPLGTVTIDTTTNASLYLTDDAFADIVNALYVAATPLISVTNPPTPFPRVTGVPQILHGDGSPEGVVFAPQGSAFMRRDNSGSSNALYAKATGPSLSTGWQAFAGSSAAPVTTLPANPTNGLQVVLVDSTSSPTYAWLLQYNTAISKWLFIGGSPALVTVNTQQSPSASGSYVDLATSGPSFTAPRAGSYYVEWGASASAQSNAGLSTASMIVTNASNTQWGTDVAVTNNGGGVSAGIWVASDLTGLAASDVIKCRYQCSAATTGYFANRKLRVIPVALT
jgi:hypothetical protein